MAKTLVIVCTAAIAAGCVSLTKPEQVAECAATNSCVNQTDAGASKDAKSDLRDGPIKPSDAPQILDAGADATVVADASMASDGPSADVPIALDVAGDVADAKKTDGPTDGPRDSVAIDVPAGACWSGSKPLPAGTVCRPAIDLCDVAESCDGVSADCPADKLAAAGTSCRPSAGDCDIAETCDGIRAACPADVFMQAGKICRDVKAANLCDVAESCTGTSPTCPLDSFAPANTICHPSTDNSQCDPAETCPGTSGTCPTDVHYNRPGAPANPTATPGTLQISVAWTKAAADATGYNVKRSATSGSGYTTLGSTPTATDPPYVDKGLTGGTLYYYVISAINTVATCESANSVEVSATPTGICTPPAAPVATATPGNGTVTLTWPRVVDAISYTVARSLSSGTGYATVAQVTPGTTTTYVDSNVANGTTYYYVVTASNGTCSSVNSAEASAAPACTPPATPTSLIATPANGSVALAWTASDGATSYSVYKNSTGAATYTFVNSTPTTTFADTNVANGTTYYYVVTASNGSCSSAYSAQVSVTPACIPPDPPTGVTVTPGDGQNAISWTASNGATLYGVSRNTTGTGSFNQIATPATTNYLDKSLTNGTTYYYVVTASNGSCSSANSAVASATPVCTPPSVPGAITATAGDGTVTLSWGASTPVPASYTVQRRTGAAGTWAAIASPTVTSYTDSGLTNGTTYDYQISASNGSCSSGYNATVSATPVAGCAQTAPTNPKATATGSVQVTLTWTAATVTPSGGYNIARSTSSTTGFASIGTVTSSTLTYVDTSADLLKNTVYYYQITAAGSCTATSSTVSVTTACANPAIPSPTATADASGNITITWAAVSGATAYTVYRSTSAGGTYSAISTNQTAATYTDPSSGLANGTVYFYKVSASNASGQCASSQSSDTSARACTIPAVPIGVSALRSGNKQATLAWTNSTGATSYKILRSTTSGSGYTLVGTASGTPYNDTSATNGTAYYYAIVAASDAAGNCSSGNSLEVSVPSCTVWPLTTHYEQLSGVASPWCVVTCADISSGSGYAQTFGCGSRTAYFNGVQTTCGSNVVTPAKVNGGYAFYFTAAPDPSASSGGWVGAQVGNVVADANCP